MPKTISVLHVGKYFSPFTGGIESFMAELLPAQSRGGIEVSTVVHDHASRLRGKVRTLSVATPNFETVAASKKKIRVYLAPSWGRLVYAPLSPQFPMWFKKAIKIERPDILHLHLPNTSAFWVLFLNDAKNIPWVIHWHADVVSSDLDWRLKLTYPLYRRFEQQLLRRAKGVVVTSPAYLKTSQALESYRDKCRVVPLAADPGIKSNLSVEACAAAEELWGKATFRILSVGRLTYYKGHEYLIQAITDLPWARLLIVGEGERRRILEKAVSDLGLSDRVVLTGQLSATHLQAVMSSCDCFCLPSTERTEAFGMVLLEAMAHSKPTVVCDIQGSGVSWVVKDGETGRVVPAASPGALADVFRSFSEDRAQSVRMGQAGYQRYLSKFGIERVGDEIHHLYKDVLNQLKA